MDWAIRTIWIGCTNLGALEYIYTLLKYFKDYFSILLKLERSNSLPLWNPLPNSWYEKPLEQMMDKGMQFILHYISETSQNQTTD